MHRYSTCAHTLVRVCARVHTLSQFLEGINMGAAVSNQIACKTDKIRETWLWSGWVCNWVQSVRKSGQEIGLGPRIGSDLMSAIEHGLLMGSHLGRLLRKAPFTAVHPNQAILPTCPLLHGALARHGEVISSLGSSVNEKESRVEKGQSSHPAACLLRTRRGAGLGCLFSKRTHKPDAP